MIRNLFCLLALVVICSTCRIGVAQTRKISVEGVGEIDAKPDQLQFSATIIKYGKTAGKAKEEFEKQKAEFLTAFNVMKFKGLSVKSVSKVISVQAGFGGGGPAMGAPFGGPVPLGAFGGGGGFGGGGLGGEAAPVAEGEQQYYASETFQLTLDGIDRMPVKELDSKIIEFTNELKRNNLIAIGGFSTALANKTPHLNKAYAKAIAVAKSKATELAKLTETRVGKVLEIAEQPLPLQTAFDQVAMISGSYGGAGFGGVNSTHKVSVTIHVTFELLD